MSRHLVLWIVAVVVVLFIVIGVIGALTQPSATTASLTAPTATMSRSTATVTVAMAASTPFATATALPAPTTTVDPNQFLDDYGPQYAPSGDKRTCATVTDPMAVVTVIQSDTSDPAPSCTKPLLIGFYWADSRVPNETLICTADTGYEKSYIYEAGSRSDYTKGLCQAIANNPAYTVTYTQ